MKKTAPPDVLEPDNPPPLEPEPDSTTPDAQAKSSFWPSFAGAKAAANQLADSMETLGESALAKTRQAGRSIGNAAVKAAKATRDAVRPDHARHAAQPIIETSRKALATFNETVDPAAVGGAVAGMEAGGAVGAAIGAVIGTLAGPAGTVLGAEAGAFAGAVIGSKMGYDVTHEVAHPDEIQAKKSLPQRLIALPEVLSRKAGEKTGEKAGGASGAAIGGTVAGPVGALVGAAFGEAIAGEFGESGGIGLYRKAQRLRENNPEAEEEQIDPKQWLSKSARNAAGGTGTEAALAAIGGLIAGPAGERIGQRAGIVAGAKMDWSLKGKAEPAAETGESKDLNHDGKQGDIA
jgi:hypothetical protein